MTQTTAGLSTSLFALPLVLFVTVLVAGKDCQSLYACKRVDIAVKQASTYRYHSSFPHLQPSRSDLALETRHLRL